MSDPELSVCPRCNLVVFLVKADGLVHMDGVECVGAMMNALQLSQAALRAAQAEIFDAIDGPDHMVLAQIADALRRFPRPDDA